MNAAALLLPALLFYFIFVLWGRCHQRIWAPSLCMQCLTQKRFVSPKNLPYKGNNTVFIPIFSSPSIGNSSGRGWSAPWIKWYRPISSIDQVRCCITLEVTHFNNRSHGLAPNLAIAHGCYGRRFAWWVGGVHRSSLLRAGPNVCVCVRATLDITTRSIKLMLDLEWETSDLSLKGGRRSCERTSRIPIRLSAFASKQVCLKVVTCTNVCNHIPF